MNTKPVFPEKFYNFLIHYYRAETFRETAWRNRLDITTNWAIVVTAAIVSFVFSNPESPHSIILINYTAVWFFLYLESRRYRIYNLLKDRTRLIEDRLLAPMIAGQLTDIKYQDWMGELSHSLDTHHLKMSRIEAVAWRIRRNYIVILPILYLIWLAKVSPALFGNTGIAEIMNHAQVWFIPGSLVFTGVTLSLFIAILMAILLPTRSKTDDLP